MGSGIKHVLSDIRLL